MHGGGRMGGPDGALQGDQRVGIWVIVWRACGMLGVNPFTRDGDRRRGHGNHKCPLQRRGSRVGLASMSGP